MRNIWGLSYMTFGAILANTGCNAGKAERVNMKKKELLGKIEELEHEIDLLKERVKVLEGRPPVVTYPTLPEPQKLPINPWDTWKRIPMYPSYPIYC